jgi:hypothetical protein
MTAQSASRVDVSALATTTVGADVSIAEAADIAAGWRSPTKNMDDWRMVHSPAGCPASWMEGSSCRRLAVANRSRLWM